MSAKVRQADYDVGRMPEVGMDGSEKICRAVSQGETGRCSSAYVVVFPFFDLLLSV